MGKKQNPLSVYATVSQIAFVILCPLLVFCIGGSYAVDHFGWEQWVKGIFVVLGIIVMISGAVSYLKQLIKQYGRDEKKVPKNFNTDLSDNDYYDDYKNLRK